MPDWTLRTSRLAGATTRRWLWTPRTTAPSGSPPSTVEATRLWQTQIASFRVESCGSTPATEVLLSESFEAADSFDAWTVVNGPGHDCGDWKRTDTAGRRPTASAGFYALSDSADCRMKSFEIDTSLDSPPLDLAALDVLSVTLELNIRRKCEAGDIATVEAWDGAAWQVIATLPEEEMQTGLTLDVTPYAAGNPAFQVRLRHRTTHKGSWWSADDVTVTAEVSGALAP